MENTVSPPFPSSPPWFGSNPLDWIHNRGFLGPVQMILRSTYLLRGVLRLERRVTDIIYFHRAVPR